MVRSAAVFLALVWSSPRAQAQAAGDLYFTTTQCRLLDTRKTSPIPNGTALPVTASGNCGIPAGADAITLNVTADAPPSDGTLTLYSGASAPTSPTLIFRAGIIRADNAIVTLDASGQFNVLPTLTGSVNVLIDVSGYFVALPVAMDDSYQTSLNTPLHVAAPGVLGNDAGSNLQAMVFNGPTTHGTVALAADGSFDYTPTTGYSGPDSFPYTAQNAAGTSSATVNLTVLATAPTITSANSTTFAPGKAGQTFTVTTTGNPTNTITRTGPLPSGVSFTDNGNNTATIAGTPAAGTQGASPYAWTITAANTVLPNATQSFTFNVVCPAITVSGTIPALTFNTAMATAAFTQGGGNGTIAWSQTGLPTGTGINSSSGQVTGTPSVTGTFSVTITATDAGGCTGSKGLTVTVAPVAGTDSYSNLVDNTQAVVTGGSTSSPLTPFVPLSGSVLANDQPSGGVTLTAGTFATTAGGSVTLATDGTFIYTPKANPGAAAITSDSFTYIISSNTGGGAAVTAMGTVNLTLGGRVWYVNNSGSNGNGQSQSPFNTMTGADTASIANDYVFVHTGIGTTTGSTSLLGGQTLWGQGTTFTLNGLTILAGTKPTVGGTVTLGGNNITVSSLDISTGSSTGITNTGTISGITIKNNITVTTTTGTAVSFSNLNSTAGGAPNNGLNFRSVSANGAANGIVLTNVNTTTGSFTITGDGTNNASGGTIQNVSGAGISLSGVGNLSLTSMKIQNTSGSGVKGALVSGFVFHNGTIDNSGTGGGVDESNIAFNSVPTATETNLTGVVSITGNVLTNSRYHGVDIQQFGGTITSLDVSGNTLTSSTSAASSLGTAIRIGVRGTALQASSINGATVNNNTITNFPSGAGILVQAGNGTSAGAPGSTLGTVATPLTITGNLIAGPSGTNMGTQAINAAVDGVGTSHFDISNNGTVANPLANTNGVTIAFSAFGNATATGTINGNHINSNSTINGQPGIAVGVDQHFAITDAPSLIISSLANNVIQNTPGNGILAKATDCNGIMKVSITNNNVAAPLGGVRPGIRVDSGNNAAGENTTVCVNITGNVSAGSGGTNGIGLRKQGTNSIVDAFGVVGMAATSSPGVETYVSGLNPSGNGVLLISATSGFSNCTIP